MELRNIRGHRIRWGAVAAQGAVVGIISAFVMLVVAVLGMPLVTDSADGWSFLKVVSGVVLGEEGTTPLAGFAAGPVFLGLAIHIALGVVAGVTYALLVAMFDLEGWTPVALFGLLYGAMLFVWSIVLVDALMAPVVSEQVPVMVVFLGNMFFGMTAGILLATWADDKDLDQRLDERVPVFEGDEPNSHRLLH